MDILVKLLSIFLRTWICMQKRMLNSNLLSASCELIGKCVRLSDIMTSLFDNYSNRANQRLQNIPLLISRQIYRANSTGKQITDDPHIANLQKDQKMENIKSQKVGIPDEI